MASNLLVDVHLNNTIDFPGATYSIFVFGEAGETVRVRNDAGYRASFDLDRTGFHSLSLPLDVVMSGTNINDQGLQITSSGDISAFLSARAPATTDLSIIFDETSLGSSYVIASYTQGVSVDGGQFSVQALHDNTRVTYLLPDGQRASLQLDAGETYKFAATVGDPDRDIAANGSLDITGTLIRASDDVAVFSGNAITNIRDGAADHIIEEMPPIKFLSNDYVVGEAFNNGTGNNVVRVVAATDNTRVTVDGERVATLDAGKYYEFLLDHSAAKIHTSAPALVAQYLSGATTAGEGDPAMSFVPGSETWLKEYAVATPVGTEAFAANLVNIVIPTAAIDTLEINGDAVDPALFTRIGGTGLSVANIDVDPGIVRAEASEKFQLSVFGYDFFDSFLTFGGASFAAGIVNAPPLAANDAFAAPAGARIDGSVVRNDSDADNDRLAVTLLNDADHGNLVLARDGTFTYRSDAGFVGRDHFVYRVSDGNGGSDTAIATIKVEGSGDLTPRNDDFSGNGRDERLDALAGNDAVSGLGGDDTIVGRAGADTLRGGAGDDVQLGGDGRDRVMGGAGADTVAGGDGIDRLMGGAGDDVFVLARGAGHAVIDDFVVGQDRIGLVGLVYRGIEITADGVFGLVEDGRADLLATFADGTPSGLTRADVVTDPFADALL